MSAVKLSDAERVKTQSNFLRGTLEKSLADSVTGAIATDDQIVIKFHGSYQQDDRDSREQRRQAKLEPDYSFMIRTRLPGGVCSPSQWLAMDALATTYANQSLRITTRQAFQFHGVIKTNLKTTIAGMNKVLIDTLAACGDVNRNVLCTANPVESAAHAEAYDWATKLSEHLLPNTRAYHEIWLDGEKLVGEEVEPIYGPTYLPRKFKAAVVVPPSNDVDVYAQDLGFIAIVDNGKLQGFNVSVGGGMGSSHGDATTWPRLADEIGFCTPDQLLEVAEKVVTTQRDFGNRSERKHARLKYTIGHRSVAWFKVELELRLGFALQAARPFHFENNGDRYGWIEGHDGNWHLTLHINAGRVADTQDCQGLTGLREIAKIHQGDFRLTANQNVIIASVAADQRAAIDALVAQYGLDSYRTISPLRRDALACVALPTCSLAMAEAERYLPDFNTQVETLLDKHGLLAQPILFRITGCPNGCARPFLAEIALVGKAPGRYNLFLGGDFLGQRLNSLYRENIDEAEILDVLDGLFARYASERNPQEYFGDFLHRAGLVGLPKVLEGVISYELA